MSKKKINNEQLLKKLVIDAVYELRYALYPEHTAMIVNKYNRQWVEACTETKDYDKINLFTVSLQLAVKAARQP